MSRKSGAGADYKWRYLSRWGEESRILSEVRALSRRLCFPADRTEDMVSALAEACLNAAEHGNAMNPERWVRVELHVEGGGVLLRVQDEGPGADETRLKPRERLTEEGSERGWGILLMKELADELRFFQGEYGMVTELQFRMVVEEERDE